MKEKYSCFNCPSTDYSLKELTDNCPHCDEEFGFPLFDSPASIGDITITAPLARGFYGATYIGEISPFGGIKIKKAIKIVPVELYKAHNKDFRKECEYHLEISQNSNHVVKIDSSIFYEDLPVTFKNGITVNCHVVGLEFIQGKTLKQYLESSESISAPAIAQISVDLINILKELRRNEKYHNDLHPGNLLIEELSVQKRRVGEIDENIKVVAIDLGSLNQQTKSNDETNRVGDLHWVAQCLNTLSRKITDNSEYYDEKDWRLAFLLEEKADYLKPSVISQKQISYSDLINQIRDTFYQHSNPWQEELKLKSFDDSVNAQSLRPWYIPTLFVDQNNTWINSISTKGPQVITGMRGCGKTMLLRALEFHARVVPQNQGEKERKSEIIRRLKSDDGYIGLYVSCVKLLDFNASNFEDRVDIFEPYSKLFLGYTIQAIQSIRHLKDIDNSCVRGDYFNELINVLTSVVSNSTDLSNVTSDYELEKTLKKYLNSLSDGKSTYKVNIHPKIAFPQLADAIKKASDVFSNSYIYFLLDDVSTRYLTDGNILKLVSELLFQDETCAFKFTTEAQTLEMVIMAPGNTSHAKIGRDYTVFDLGSEVNKIIHENHHEGKEFIEKILSKRAKYFALHPQNLTVSSILGDKTLISIAENIVKETKASEKKGIYQGISALTAVCVGDLGDVITLYELILKRNSKKNFPVPAKIQNECYLELCNSRLFDLNRKNTRYLDFVQSFADASHHLLIQSAIKKAKGETKKLRQYTSIFINITFGDKDKQYKQIRDLIDAGIFNLHGGPEASRTNRQGLNPQQQFKLIFRKLYGVTKHIGLSSADRFELSGKDLNDWLKNPKDGKKTLIKPLNSYSEEELESELEEINLNKSLKPEAVMHFPAQQELFSINPGNGPEVAEPNFDFIIKKLPTVTSVTKGEIEKLKFDNIIVGLGFEEATLESAKRISKLVKGNLILVEFDDPGKGKEIIDHFQTNGFDTSQTVHSSSFAQAVENIKGSILCDITGLTKSVIFESIRNILSSNQSVYFSITNPEIEYPLDEEIKNVFDRTKNADQSVLLTEISNLIKGEQGPYTLINLLPHYTNISEARVLFSFAPIKHERLYTLLDEREYEKINIIVPDGKSPKEKLAQISAEFSLRKYNNADIHYVSTSNINEVLSTIAKDYYTYFVEYNSPFEFALTGTKLQTVSAAIFSSVFKVSQCWYMKPKTWDKTRFSRGALKTSFFKVQRKD
ncbi:MAG: protein kinase [Pyrinomonadaceae bacterium]|nr:protein kinase [Pyrinomonadaceae bacterium]